MLSQCFVPYSVALFKQLIDYIHVLNELCKTDLTRAALNTVN